jgi:hypothetical protein
LKNTIIQVIVYSVSASALGLGLGMFFEPGGLPFPLVGTFDSGSTVSVVVPLRSVELPCGGGGGNGGIFDDTTEIAGEPDFIEIA